MCRLLGVAGASAAPLAELLDDSLAPFLALAAEHDDGWGIGYVDSADGVVLAKEADRADLSDTCRSLIEETVTDLAIVHLRLASPQLAVGTANSHPFGDASCAFAHNGHFVPADALHSILGHGLIAAAEGDTDSERFYLAVRQRIDDGTAPAVALAGAAADIRALAAEWVSLNCLLITPQAIYAYADHDPDSEVIERRGPGFFDLSYLVEPGRIVIASTGWPQPSERWTRLPERRVLEVTRHDLHVTVHQ
jgi:predicted glutamine amidotransferase